MKLLLLCGGRGRGRGGPLGEQHRRARVGDPERRVSERRSSRNRTAVIAGNAVVRLRRPVFLRLRLRLRLRDKKRRLAPVRVRAPSGGALRRRARRGGGGEDLGARARLLGGAVILRNETRAARRLLARRLVQRRARGGRRAQRGARGGRRAQRGARRRRSGVSRVRRRRARRLRRLGNRRRRRRGRAFRNSRRDPLHLLRERVEVVRVHRHLHQVRAQVLPVSSGGARGFARQTSRRFVERERAHPARQRDLLLLLLGERVAEAAPGLRRHHGRLGGVPGGAKALQRAAGRRGEPAHDAARQRTAPGPSLAVRARRLLRGQEFALRLALGPVHHAGDVAGRALSEVRRRGRARALRRGERELVAPDRGRRAPGRERVRGDGRSEARVRRRLGNSRRRGRFGRARARARARRGRAHGGHAGGNVPGRGALGHREASRGETRGRRCAGVGSNVSLLTKVLLELTVRNGWLLPNRRSVFRSLKNIFTSLLVFVQTVCAYISLLKIQHNIQSHKLEKVNCRLF